MRGIAAVLAIGWAGLASSQQVPPSRHAASFADDTAARAAEVEALEPAVGIDNASAAGERANAAPRSGPEIRRVRLLGHARANASKPQQTQAREPAVPRAVDHVDLGTTSITGNQELPTVLYIVPWKRSDLGELVGRPVNTLLDDVLAPVDRDVFKRHLEYYDALFDSAPASSGNASGDDKE